MLRGWWALGLPLEGIYDSECGLFSGAFGALVLELDGMLAEDLGCAFFIFVASTNTVPCTPWVLDKRVLTGVGY